MLKKGNITYYPALIKHLPEHILELFMDDSIFYKNNLVSMVIPTSNTGGDKGVYFPSDDFYTEINATSISYEFPFDSVPCKVSGTSQNATEEYVKNLENNAPQMFGEQPENGNAWILPLIIIVSVAVAVSIAVIFVKRNRDPAHERTQPVKNEYTESSDEEKRL
ncbi:MAG: hypothetical protein GXO25_01055 [Euryarchaeota archaeon]|nr:hypothetical protein [Euryarchaeota archaeon]